MTWLRATKLTVKSEFEPQLVILAILMLSFSYREKKRERERDDLWRKMQDLSLRNAAKEGISLGQQIELSI